MDLFSLFMSDSSAITKTTATEGTSALQTVKEEEKVKEPLAPEALTVTPSAEEVSESPADEKAVMPAESVASVTSFPDFGSVADASDDDDSDEASDDDDDDDDSSSKAKKAPKKKAEKKLTGPVTVKGTGWSFTYGELGSKYTGKEVLKAAFNAGYKEVLIGACVCADDNTIVCKTVSQSASNEDLQMGDELTVMLGNFRAEYKVSDFTGLEAAEVSIFDVLMKFQDSNPDFKGCSFIVNFSAKTATPCFNGTFKPDKDTTYLVWSDNGHREVEGAALIESGASIYKSDTDILFVEDKVDAKASRFTLSIADVDITEVKSKTAKELYRLPCILFVETYGAEYELKPEDFGGKEVLDENDIVNFLKAKHRLFRQSNRQLNILFDREARRIGVAVVSGKKGAAIAAPSSRIIDFSMWLASHTRRVEETALGIFKGLQNDKTLEVSNLEFNMKLPKIPRLFLETIISEFREDLSKENMVQIYWSKDKQEFYMVKPEATYSKVAVSYKMGHTNDILVISIHSHNTMNAFFSEIDDADEIYTGLFGVIGNLDKSFPSMCFRAGMEGCFKPLSVDDIFEGGEAA